MTGFNTNHLISKKPHWFIDLIIFALIGAIIFGLTSFEAQWAQTFTPNTPIDLSLSALPRYTFFSTLRALIAYFFSFIFTIVVGLWVTKDRLAEKIVIPLLDIMQSIPVLGFLPGLVLTLIHFFPHNNMGLELSTILMIFTGQVWNMVFSFYASLKGIPGELKEATRMMNLGFFQRLIKLELPFGATNLAWNSIMSMAGGWFFLSVCESFVLGDQEYRLPGLGSYMALASARGDHVAMVGGVVAMMVVIISMDVFLWRPVMAYAHRFRLENDPQETYPTLVNQKNMQQMFISTALHHSHFFQWYFRFWGFVRRLAVKGVKKLAQFIPSEGLPLQKIAWEKFSFLKKIILVLFIAFLLPKFWGLIRLLTLLPLITWRTLLEDTAFTFLRVVFTLVVSAAWVLPVGIWFGLHRKHIHWARPLIQMLASFPAPMLYPLMLGLFFKMGLSFHFCSPLLMLLGVQWYVLFNVLAAAMFMPRDLVAISEMTNLSTYKRWMHLYIPSVFPSLVTGLLTAAGGAFNASIVSEYISYQGKFLSTQGLGRTIALAAEKGDYSLLAGALTVMVLLVILLNRVVWAKLYHLAETRFRMDL